MRCSHRWAGEGTRPYVFSLGQSIRTERAMSRLSRPRDRFFCFFIRRAATFGFALIPELFTLGECKFYFHSTVFEVHAGRDQSQSLLLGLTDQLADLFLVDEEFPCPQGSVIVDVPVLVLPDVAVQKPEFAILHQSVGVLERDLAGTDGFHLGTC